MKTSIESNPLGLPDKKPTLLLKAVTTNDQLILEELVKNYEVYFGRSASGGHVMYVELPLERKREC